MSASLMMSTKVLCCIATDGKRDVHLKCLQTRSRCGRYRSALYVRWSKIRGWTAATQCLGIMKLYTNTTLKHKKNFKLRERKSDRERKKISHSNFKPFPAPCTSDSELSDDDDSTRTKKKALVSRADRYRIKELKREIHNSKSRKKKYGSTHKSK